MNALIADEGRERLQELLMILRCYICRDDDDNNTTFCTLAFVVNQDCTYRYTEKRPLYSMDKRRTLIHLEKYTVLELGKEYHHFQGVIRVPLRVMVPGVTEWKLTDKREETPSSSSREVGYHHSRLTATSLTVITHIVQ